MVLSHWCGKRAADRSRNVPQRVDVVVSTLIRDAGSRLMALKET